MTAGHRAALRDAAYEALAVDDHFAAMELIRGWTLAVDPEHLPAYGVMTPSEQAGLQAKDQLRRMVRVDVVLKRQGDELIEDRLDEDALRIEAVVWPALLALPEVTEVDQTGTSIALDGAGGQRMGVVQVSFNVLLFTSAPA